MNNKNRLYGLFFPPLYPGCALLGYNLHATKCTHLQYTAWWILTDLTQVTINPDPDPAHFHRGRVPLLLSLRLPPWGHHSSDFFPRVSLIQNFTWRDHTVGGLLRLASFAPSGCVWDSSVFLYGNGGVVPFTVHCVGCYTVCFFIYQAVYICAVCSLGLVKMAGVKIFCGNAFIHILFTKVIE